MPTDQKNISIVKIIFAVLILALAGELIFIFSSANKKNQSSSVVPTGNTVTIMPSGTIKVEASTDFNVNALQVNYSVGHESTNNNILTKEIQGKISGLKSDKNGLFPEQKFAEKENVFQFILNKIKPVNLKITDSVGKILSYADLKLGQNVKVIFVQDSSGIKDTMVEITIL